MSELTDNLLEVFERLLRRQRCPTRATQQFKTWKHNTHILPRLQMQLDTVREALNKFEPIVYDTQGVRDDGTDITVRFRTSNEGDEESELIGFQVKSYDDLCKRDYLRELKAQRYDSFNKVLGLRFYFIVICTDAEEHSEKVRSINAEFRSADKTKVIEPRFAYTFLSAPATTAEAFVKRAMQAEDIVFRNALDSLDELSPSAQALAVFLATKYVISGKRQFLDADVVGDNALRRVYDELREKLAELIEATLDKDEFGDSDVEDEGPGLGFSHEEPVIQLKDFEDQITEDLDALEGNILDRDISNMLVLRTEQLQALNAVIADALARYNYDQVERSGSRVNPYVATSSQGFRQAIDQTSV